MFVGEKLKTTIFVTIENNMLSLIVYGMLSILSTLAMLF